MASELVPVEQEDREAAAGLMRAWKMLPDRLADHVLEGDEDSTVFVQAFARHRLAALEAQASRIAELEAGIKLAAVWFEEYALLHRAKGTAEGNDKGQRNQDRADQLRALLGDREG